MYIGTFVVVFLDNIFILNNNIEQHIDNINIVYVVLMNDQLHIKLKQCHFFEELLYLMFLLSR